MRIVDHDLVNSYRGVKCLVCNNRDTVAHHVKTKGARGDDIEDNLMPLCFLHHREVHDKGLTKFSEKYEEAFNFLSEKNWEFDCYMERWFYGKKR